MLCRRLFLVMVRMDNFVQETRQKATGEEFTQADDSIVYRGMGKKKIRRDERERKVRLVVAAAATAVSKLSTHLN